jgi:hypothetical protein
LPFALPVNLVFGKYDVLRSELHAGLARGLHDVKVVGPLRMLVISQGLSLRHQSTIEPQGRVEATHPMKFRNGHLL